MITKRISPSGPPVPMARLSATGTQTITVGTATVLEFDVIDFDKGGLVAGTPPAPPFDRFTAPEDGFYSLSGFFRLTTGVDEELIVLIVNLTTFQGCGRSLAATPNSSPSADAVTCIVEASEGDELQFLINAEDGAPGSRDVDALRYFYIEQVA